MKMKSLNNKTGKSAMIGKGFEFNPATHRYYLDGRQMTGCTTILGVVNKPMLIGWASKMAVEYIAENIAALVTGSVDDQKRILEEAKNAHARKRDSAAEKGTDFHALAEHWVKDCIAENKGRAMKNGIYNPAIMPFIEWAIENDITFLAS